MKRLVVLIPFFLFSCATAEITLNRDALMSIKTVAIAPFSSSLKLEKEILTGAEEIFRSAFIRMNYNVVESVDSGLALKDKEYADALLLGEITEYKEIRKEVLPYNSNAFGNFIFHGAKDKHDEIKIKTTFTFRIAMRLLKVSDGAVILSAENRYPETEKDDYMPGYLSLDSYRKMVLKKMADELVETMNRN